MLEPSATCSSCSPSENEAREAAHESTLKKKKVFSCEEHLVRGNRSSVWDECWRTLRRDSGSVLDLMDTGVVSNWSPPTVFTTFLFNLCGFKQLCFKEPKILDCFSDVAAETRPDDWTMWRCGNISVGNTSWYNTWGVDAPDETADCVNRIQCLHYSFLLCSGVVFIGPQTFSRLILLMC